MIKMFLKLKCLIFGHKYIIKKQYANTNHSYCEQNCVICNKTISEYKFN